MSDLEDRQIEMTQSEEGREKILGKKKRTEIQGWTGAILKSLTYK